MKRYRSASASTGLEGSVEIDLYELDELGELEIELGLDEASDFASLSNEDVLMDLYKQVFFIVLSPYHALAEAERTDRVKSSYRRTLFHALGKDALSYFINNRFMGIFDAHNYSTYNEQWRKAYKREFKEEVKTDIDVESAAFKMTEYLNSHKQR